MGVATARAPSLYRGYLVTPPSHPAWRARSGDGSAQQLSATAFAAASAW